jgi:hypothetical protein
MQYINNMIHLSAETSRDQEIMEKFQRAYVNLKKIVDKLQEGNRRNKIRKGI